MVRRNGCDASFDSNVAKLRHHGIVVYPRGAGAQTETLQPDRTISRLYHGPANNGRPNRLMAVK
jgi:hypothetical protein